MIDNPNFSKMLPSLRRLSRAACGSQVAGDRAVVQLVDFATINGENSDDLKLSTLKLLASLLIGAASSDGARQRIQARLAMLLTKSERLSWEEAASVLDLKNNEFVAVQRGAEKELSQLPAARVLVVEDDPFAAEDIAWMLDEAGHFVVDCVATEAAASQSFKQSEPSLVIIDVNLAWGDSGVNLAKTLWAERDVATVFVTASPELVLTGSRTEPNYVVRKPFQKSDLLMYVAQALAAKQPIEPMLAEIA